VQRDGGMVLAELDGDLVFQSHSLHKRPEIMESVGAAVENSEDEINLGGGENGN